jgi:hypothetical protein
MPVTVREFSALTDLKPVMVIADLMQLGIFATLNLNMTEVSVKSVGAKNGFNIGVISPPSA